MAEQRPIRDALSIETPTARMARIGSKRRRRGAASVQKGRHDVRRRSSDRGWVTPDWEVFGCALSPCIPSRLLEEIRWRDVGENSSQQVGVDFIAPKRRR
ncbi:hypothetical protein LSAT2_000812 [Lamellibrachia satsuma]|nr:hypothetical protein LSAT2_000812 [Lamellibrachia satsuma]